MAKIEVKKEDQIARVILNRPEAFNALDLDTAESLAKSMVNIASDETVRGVVISGEGKAFCAGGDLKWASAHPMGLPAAFHELAGRFHHAVVEIRRMSKPVVAAINGVAAGAGFSLALACDFRVMAKSASLRQAYTSAGLCIDGGGTFMLPRLIGASKALEIAALDAPISSEKALALGLVNGVVEDGQVVDEAMKMAMKLKDISLSSFGWSKRLIMESFATTFETHLEREREGISACASHQDGREGVRAFAEKRKPIFNVK